MKGEQEMKDRLLIWLLVNIAILCIFLGIGIREKNDFIADLQMQIELKNNYIAEKEKEIAELNEVIEAKQKIQNGFWDEELFRIILSYSEKQNINLNKISNLDDDVRSKSGLTAEQIDIILKGTILEGRGKDFIIAEFVYDINAHFLLSVSAHETGWWRSNFARNRNNLFGWRAYTHNPQMAMCFDDTTHCILYVAERLQTLYLSPEGKYFRGGTVSAIGKIYATDPEWANKVIRTSGYIEQKLIEV